VGLDGRALTNQNRIRGIGLYTARLLENLVRATDDYDFVVFGEGPCPDDELLGKDTLDRLTWWELPRHERVPYHDVHIDHLTLARSVDEACVALFHGIDHNLSPLIRCPTIVTVHDLIPIIMPGPYLGPRNYLWVTAHRIATRRARLVVAVSDNTRQDVERLWKVPGERIKVVYEGAYEIDSPSGGEPAEGQALRKYGIDRPYFIGTGGFDPRKNISNILEAFKLVLLKEGDRFQLVLTGELGRFSHSIREELVELDIEHSVVLPGFIPDGDLASLRNRAVALVFVSLYEGFGLPPLEAMKHGTPVLTSRVSSIPEVVGEAGLYVEPLEPEDIAAGMLRLASDEDLREELKKKGLEQAKRFTWEETARELLALYPLVLRGGEGR
jgi:glycosyltransferase involved in cell wall biosynthesis